MGKRAQTRVNNKEWVKTGENAPKPQNPMSFGRGMFKNKIYIFCNREAIGQAQNGGTLQTGHRFSFSSHWSMQLASYSCPHFRVLTREVP